MSHQQSSSGHRNRRNQSSTTRRQRPNYFLSVPLAHYDSITSHISKIQDELIKAQPELEGALVDPASAHVTLFVLTLNKSSENQEESEVASVDDAVRCLKESVSTLKAQSLLQTFNLRFKGLGTFSNKVLFVEPEMGDGLTTLQRVGESLSEYFFTQGLLKELPREYNAHLTVAKTSNLFSRRGPRPTNRNVRIPESSYEMYKEAPVQGEFVVDEIQLCQMQGRKHGSYYTVAASISLQE